ncbi:hypothetical protein FOL47_004151, partial [Perkinsus chesapeaki]
MACRAKIRPIFKNDVAEQEKGPKGLTKSYALAEVKENVAEDPSEDLVVESNGDPPKANRRTEVTADDDLALTIRTTASLMRLALERDKTLKTVCLCFGSNLHSESPLVEHAIQVLLALCIHNMATPDYEQLVPPIGDFEDKAVHSNIVDLAKGRQLDGIKQSLSAYRRKRTVAQNAIKDIRRLIADEPLGGGAEKIERDYTLTKQISIWSDANKACRSLEKIEEAIDDEGWLTTTSGQEEPLPRPRRSPRVGAERRTPRDNLTTVKDPVSTSPSQHNPARGVITQTVTKIDLPKLKDKFSLQHHLRVCENMLQEAEVGIDVEGQFKPLGRLQYNVVTKILGTLVDHKDIFQLASDTAEQSDHDWVYVRRVLLTTYAKRETLVDEYRAVVLRIKYVNCDRFCAEARKLYAMASRLFGIGNTYEIRGLVETLVSRLPPERA